MDTEHWGDPHVFRPERFLDADNKISNTERFVSFGQGKRKCLGEALARASLFIFTVGILQKFSLEIPPNGQMPENQSQAGLLTTPTPYEIVFKFRWRVYIFIKNPLRRFIIGTEIEFVNWSKLARHIKYFVVSKHWSRTKKALKDDTLNEYSNLGRCVKIILE